MTRTRTKDTQPVMRLANIYLFLAFSFLQIQLFNKALRLAQIHESASASLSIYWTQPQPAAVATDATAISLADLANTFPETECPDGLHLIQDKWIDPRVVYSDDRLIPRLIHVTGKSRCVSEFFRNNLIVHWRNIPDHAFVFYNDAAVDRLLTKHFAEFPHMAQVLPCIRGGAAKADLFRAVVVWEYGGIYTDVDNSIVNFNASTTLAANDQAFFVIEYWKMLSQFFFAAKPRHPIMHLLVQHTLLRLLMLNDVDRQYAPFVTGPSALQSAFVNFMGTQGNNEPRNAGHTSPYHNPEKEGVFQGLGNSSVTIRGNASESSYYIQRCAINNTNKFADYALMNMTHFSEMGLTGNSDSCTNRIFLRQIAETATDYAALLVNK